MARFPEDYHLHSSFSVDCDAAMEAQCERAIDLGIGELCVTDHCDWHHLDSGVGYYRPADYFAEIERCRVLFSDRLVLVAGVEVGEPHIYVHEARQLLAAWPYDFVIGSLHWVDDASVLEPEFFEGREERVAYEEYFGELAMMARAGGFDVVGHFDVPKRVSFVVYGGYKAIDHAEPIREALRACIEGGVGIEINTSTYRRGLGEPSPPMEVLRWYRELGGETLTIGSDSHNPDTLAGSFDDALALAKEAGFRYLTHFRERTPRFEPIS